MPPFPSPHLVVDTLLHAGITKHLFWGVNHMLRVFRVLPQVFDGLYGTSVANGEFLVRAVVEVEGTGLPFACSFLDIVDNLVKCMDIMI